MMENGKNDRQLLATQIEKALLEYIQAGELAVGEKLPNEFILAEKFGVGRSTIREAVKALVSKGVLQVRRGAGTYIINMMPVDEDPLGFGQLADEYKLAIELSDVRLMIEPEIVALAAQYANEEEKIHLEKLCDEVEELYIAGKNHLMKDVEFHQYIAKISRNRVVETLVPIINRAVITFGNLTYRKLMKETIDTHRAITNSVKANDTVGAKTAMITHLGFNRKMLVEMMEEKHQTNN